jgi:hypothetical protein
MVRLAPIVIACHRQGRSNRAVPRPNCYQAGLVASGHRQSLKRMTVAEQFGNANLKFVREANWKAAIPQSLAFAPAFAMMGGAGNQSALQCSSPSKRGRR